MAVRLASDPVGDVAKQYGVDKAEKNVCFPVLVVLDPEGRVVNIKKCDCLVGFSMGELLRQVRCRSGASDY